MRKFQCLLFVLKRSYICYYIICMTVPLEEPRKKNMVKRNKYLESEKYRGVFRTQSNM